MSTKSTFFYERTETERQVVFRFKKRRRVVTLVWPLLAFALLGQLKIIPYWIFWGYLTAFVTFLSVRYACHLGPNKELKSAAQAHRLTIEGDTFTVEKS